MAFFVFSVMSEFSLDDPGFTPPIPPVPPSSSDSSVETPVDGQRKCSSCPRRMSKKSADRHTVCISCRGFDCDLNSRCEECLEWSEDDVIAYAKYRKSLKSRESSSSKQKSKIPLSPLTPSRPSPQPAPQPAPLPVQQPAPRPAQPAPRPSQRDDLQSQMDSLASNFTSLSNNLTSQLTDFMAQFLCQNQSSRQPRLGPDAGESRPDQTAGESRMFQGEGAPSWTPLVPPYAQYPLHSDFAAPRPEQSGRARSRSPPFDASRASTRHAPRQPPVFEAPPQPSTSGWVPPGPPPPRSRHDSSGSDSGASGSESVTAARDSASARLTDLIYQVCPASRPLFDPKAPRCEFEGWFGQPEASTSSQRFRLYPRVAEVQEEVAARSESLARRSKPLSRILPARARSYSLADDTIFAASQPVNSAFAQLTGSKTLATRRWGSVSSNDMERLERLFLNQLEVTSSSLWLMSGISRCWNKTGSSLLTLPYSTRPFPLSLLRCLVRLVLLLQALDSFVPREGELVSSRYSPCSWVPEALPHDLSWYVFGSLWLWAPHWGGGPGAQLFPDFKQSGSFSLLASGSPVSDPFLFSSHWSSTSFFLSWQAVRQALRFILSFWES